MNRLFPLIAMLVCLLSISSAWAGNMVANGSFEDALQGWSVVKASPKGMTAEIASETARTGKRSGHIRIDEAGRYCEFRLNPNPVLKPGEQYAVRIWVKQESADANAPYIQIHSFDAAKKPTRVAYKPGKKGSHDWYPITHVFTVPEGSAFCRIDFGLVATAGNVWFDDAELHYLPAADPNALVPNPGFESGMAGWEPYNSNPKGGVFELCDATARSGIFSARIAKTETTGYVEWRIEPWPCLKAGTRYAVRAWVKQDDVEGGAPYIQVHSFNAANQPKRLALEGRQTGSRDWYVLEARVAAPADSVKCRVDFGMSGATGTVWFDDISIVEGE